MTRWFSSLFGIVMLGVGGLLLAVSARTGLPSPSVILIPPGLVLAGILKFVGGSRDSVTLGGRSVPWNVLVGLGDIILGIVVIPAVIPDMVSGNADSWIDTLGLLAGGTFMAWHGLQVARDTHRVDLKGLQTTPSGPVVVLIAILVCWMGLGLLIAIIAALPP
ncbi:hypothetical protein [Natrinema salinisoli]|uniref:hypothetical protein n=1 Tax=Natrinema salinisoli TaxID=2878535 RepID=UPI001CF0A415|nr:hypothetical protein [Natrinema salinisoli]